MFLHEYVAGKTKINKMLSIAPDFNVGRVDGVEVLVYGLGFGSGF